MLPKNKRDPSNIVAVDVYLESRKTRRYVGRLTSLKEKSKSTGGGFQFEYDRAYLYAPSSIPLGPDLPMTRKVHSSPQLFKTLDDRIPSSKNPAYKDYCESAGISPQEKDPVILLATIGKRGPSSFVFEPVFHDSYSPENYQNFRKAMGLTLREFALLFDFSVATLQRIESRKTSGKDALKRIALYENFPAVSLHQVSKNGGKLHVDKKRRVLDYFRLAIERERPSPTVE